MAQRLSFNAHTNHMLEENRTSGKKLTVEVSDLKTAIAQSEAVIKDKETQLAALVDKPFTETGPKHPVAEHAPKFFWIVDCYLYRLSHITF